MKKAILTGVAAILSLLAASAQDFQPSCRSCPATYIPNDEIQAYVKRAIANDGPRMKRIRPAPMGRAYRYQRRMAHIEIALAERLRGASASAATVVGGDTATTKKRAPGKAAKKKTASKKATAKG